MYMIAVIIISGVHPTEHSHVHDAAPGGTVLSTLPGHVEVKVQQSKVLHSP